MRIVWKDSQPSKEFKPRKYRGFDVTGYENGWITNMPGDDNIYKNFYSALNAIDEKLGGHSHKGEARKRKEVGVVVIGKKKQEALS